VEVLFPHLRQANFKLRMTRSEGIILSNIGHIRSRCWHIWQWQLTSLLSILSTHRFLFLVLSFPVK